MRGERELLQAREREREVTTHPRYFHAVWNLNFGAGRAPSTWKAPPCWAYHVVNAYDEKGVITVDLVAYESAGVVNGPHAFAYLPNMKGGGRGSRSRSEMGATFACRSTT